VGQGLKLAELRRLARDNASVLAAKKRAFRRTPPSLRELVFCLLTPQSSMKKCKDAVRALEKEGLLARGGTKEISRCLRGRTRFHNNKARWLFEARKKFDARALARIKGSHAKREWLVANIKGIGYKEASHFLRNTGRLDVAIIDRHVIHVLGAQGCRVPKTITNKEYLRLEREVVKIASRLGLEPGILDLLLFVVDAEKNPVKRAALLRELR